eukprot:COSAG02_NODE_69685_length_198_cov_36.969697_1_plen_33_part_10
MQRAFVLRIYRTRGARPFMVIDPFPVKTKTLYQ